MYGAKSHHESTVDHEQLGVEWFHSILIIEDW